MATIPLWATGRNLTLVTLTLQAVNGTTGVLSDLAVVANVTAVVEEIDHEDTVTTEEISAITSTAEHHVSIMQGSRVRVTELLTYAASVLPTTGPRLIPFRAALVAGSQIAKIVWTHGGTTWTYYGTLAGFSGPWRGKGRQTVSLAFAPVDIGSPNPVNS